MSLGPPPVDGAPICIQVRAAVGRTCNPVEGRSASGPFGVEGTPFSYFWGTRFLLLLGDTSSLLCLWITFVNSLMVGRHERSPLVGRVERLVMPQGPGRPPGP